MIKERSINRIDPFIERLAVLWKKYPDMRFGQLVEDILRLYVVDRYGKFERPTFDALLWIMEENEWIDAIDIFEKRLSND